VPAPQGLTPAPTRRNHVSGGKDTAVSAARVPDDGSPPTAQRRPLAGAAKAVLADEATADATPSPRQDAGCHAVPAAMCRRADGAHRLPAVDGRLGHGLAARDPALPGWLAWEILVVLTAPELVAA